MKHKLVTAGVVVLILAGITAFNMYYEVGPVMTAQEKETQELLKRIQEQREVLKEVPTTTGTPPPDDEEDVVPAADNGAAVDSETEAEAEANAFTRSADEVKGPDADFPEMPDVFRVRMETSKGDVVIEVTKAWAPRGAQRFHDLVSTGYYDGNRFFRVVPDFVVQWGIHGDPEVNAKWSSSPAVNPHAGITTLPDDPVLQSNQEAYVSYAAAGPNTRTTQVFINLSDNRNLDGMGFAPFGRVIEGMDVVNEFNSQYVDMPTRQQQQMQQQGNAFFSENWPGLDYIKRATIID